MSDVPQPKLTDHEYDGIREYDNPTPGWWWWLFLATVLFSVVYFISYHSPGAGWTLAVAYDDAVSTALKKQFAGIGELKGDEATLLACMAKPDYLKVGQSVYKANCVSCHGGGGEGLVGPNLTDDHYKNVRALADIDRVVAEGAAAGAMPAWKTRLHPNEVVLVSAYVASLRGQNRSGPRAAEGTVIPPWPPLPATSAPAP